jgi:NAD(P)-dependent dehydrogenase (short-subunit alcohol dehydrogenase family)
VAEVEKRGGKGIAVKLDLEDDASIAALFEQVEREQGRLDILVNNAMAIPSEMTQRLGFWEKPLSNWEIWDTGARAAFVAAWHAARIMAPQKSGLIVALSGYVGVTYTYDVIFGTTKTATDRMARDMAKELKPHNVASLSLWQGFTYTERAQENLRTVPGMAQQLNSAVGSSPEFPGRVIAALAKDAEIMAKSGGTFINAELAQEYGVTDVDGRTIPSLREQRGAPLWAPGQESNI